jgi:hypothetical protein
MGHHAVKAQRHPGVGVGAHGDVGDAEILAGEERWRLRLRP